MADKKVQLHDSAGNNLFPRILLDQIYPVGSIYISANAANPSNYFGGTWTKIGAGRTLMGASADADLGTTVNSGLPDIRGSLRMRSSSYNTGQNIWDNGGTNAFKATGQGDSTNADVLYQQGPATKQTRIEFKASSYNSIYGASSIVQPPAVYVNFWQRTA